MAEAENARRARRREAEQRELAAAEETDEGRRAESAGRRRRRGGAAAEGLPSPSEEDRRDGGAQQLLARGGDDGDGEAVTAVTSRRRRRQLELGESPADADASVSDARTTSTGVRLWTRGDRAPLASEQQAELLAALAAELEPARDAQPSALARDVVPDQPASSARLGYAASSRYAQDPVHGGFARKLHAERAADGDGGRDDDELLVARGGPSDSVAHSLARLVVSTLTLVRGLLAGLSLLHLFVIGALEPAAGVGAYAAYAPLSLSALALFQALVGVSLVATLDSNVMYTPHAAAPALRAAGPPHAASGGAGAGAGGAGGVGGAGTGLLALLYGCALLLGMLLLPLEQSLYYTYGEARLPNGRLRAAADLRELAALPWPLDDGSSGGARCQFGQLTCAAFTEERARLYRALSVARDALCLAAFLLASLYFAARPPPARTFAASADDADTTHDGDARGERRGAAAREIARVYVRPAAPGGEQPLSPTGGLGV